MTRPRFHPLVRLLIFIAGSVALTFLVWLVKEWAVAYSARVTPGMPPPDLNAPGLGLVFNALVYPPLLIWTWFCRHVFDRRNYVSLGLGITRAGRNFLAGGALGALAMALIFGILLLCGGARINGISPEALSQTTTFIAKMLLLYGALYFAVGYFEETIFRGYLLQNFSALLGKSGGVAAQAILFALIHLGNPVGTTPFTKFFAMLNIALVGWLLALCYRKSGSLWYPIGFHVAWNFFQGCVFSLPVSGSASFHLLDVSLTPNTLLSGGAFGPEAGVLPPLMLLALILLAQRLPDHARAAAEFDALRRGEDLPSAPETFTSENVAPLYPEEADDAPREYSPPRYRSSLSAAPRRAAAIDWSDVNTRGGAAATAAFTPGAAPPVATANVAANAAATSTREENAPNIEEKTREVSPIEFTPQSAPRVAAGAASTRDSSALGIAIERDTTARASRNVTGEAPLPAGARVTASRSNFGAAPRDAAARVLAAGAADATGDTASPNETRKIAAAPPLPSATQSVHATQSVPAPPPLDESPLDVLPSSPRPISAAPDTNTAFETPNQDSETDAAPRQISAPPPLPVALPTAPPLPPNENEPRENIASIRGAAPDETPRLLPAPPIFQTPEDDASTRVPQNEIETPPRILNAAPESETPPVAPPTSDTPPTETKRAKQRW